MILSMSERELCSYVCSQISHFIPDSINIKNNLLLSDVSASLEKCSFCFSHIKNNAYRDDNGQTFFSHIHADQYATFLVFLSNHIWKIRGDKLLCDRIMYINRVLHSFMMSYKAKIPDIFWLAHPVGSVIGNADYSDYLYVSQNCTINTGDPDKDGSPTPKIGKYFGMGAGSAVIGNKPIGDRCSLGVNVLLYNKDLKNNTVVINKDGEIIEKINREKCFSEKMFF